jgi:A/G-specific adenine glycosylase
MYMMRLSAKRVVSFQKTILDFYRKEGRQFPWRETRDPYAILVSEVMLQQTGVERVVPFYLSFLKKFPTPRALAGAPLSDVLAAWQGLGYNRRALYVKRAAENIMSEHGGRVPRDARELEALPGVGPYTARAVAAFAFGKPAAFVETNIRAAYLHFFFRGRKKVRDEEILELVGQTLPNKIHSPRRIEPCSVREWYHALMDYGAMLKCAVGNPNARSAHYAKQPAFKGSRRELRGKILKRATAEGFVRTADFASRQNTFRAADIFSDLAREGFLRKVGSGFALSREGR